MREPSKNFGDGTQLKFMPETFIGSSFRYA